MAVNCEGGQRPAWVIELQMMMMVVVVVVVVVVVMLMTLITVNPQSTAD
jgi:heme/copper-type cytochrome/quinol oxidase subunit 2